MNRVHKYVWKKFVDGTGLFSAEEELDAQKELAEIVDNLSKIISQVYPVKNLMFSD